MDSLRRVRRPTRKRTPKGVTKADIVERIAAGTGMTKTETEAGRKGVRYTVKDTISPHERV